MWWKKKQEYFPYNFDKEKEFAIYRHVCRQKMKRRDKKKIEGYEFSTYDEWKAYAMGKYAYVSLKSLYDVRRFFQRHQKGGNAMGEAYKSILVPWVMTILTVMLGQNLDFTGIQQWGIVAKMIALVVCSGVIIWFASMLFSKLVSYFAAQNLENLMYSDYEEIIDEMIKGRGKQEASLDRGTGQP